MKSDHEQPAETVPMPGVNCDLSRLDVDTT